MYIRYYSCSLCERLFYYCVCCDSAGIQSGKINLLKVVEALG